MTVTVLNDCVEMPNVEFNNPNGFTKGFYLSKCKEELLFQLPILQSKCGVVKNPTCDYLDLIVNDNFLIKKLISHLEKNTKEEIKKRQNIWFSNSLLDDDINYYFLDSIKHNLLRIDVPENLYVFNKDQERLDVSDIKQKEIICILEFVGLKFSTTSFKLHFSLKQVMVFESKYEKCIVNTESRTSEPESRTSETVEQTSEKVEQTSEPVEQTSEPVEQTSEHVESLESDDIVVLDKNLETSEKENTLEDESDEEEDETDESDEELSDDALSEVDIEDLVKDDNEVIELKNPNDIFKKTYYETYERAKAAKQYAIKTFLEAKKIKQLHLLSDLESSDEEDLNFD